MHIHEYQAKGLFKQFSIQRQITGIIYANNINVLWCSYQNVFL
jgi:succinyl-CoA synthetase beta subunit